MNDKDFWHKLNLKYPVAYAYMEKNFECKHSIEIDIVHIVNGDNKPNKQRIIKHPLKRDLYDFFDGEGIELTASPSRGEISYNENGKNILWEYGILDGMDRSHVEDKGFTKAFEILELRLNKDK